MRIFICRKNKKEEAMYFPNTDSPQFFFHYRLRVAELFVFDFGETVVIY